MKKKIASIIAIAMALFILTSCDNIEQRTKSLEHVRNDGTPSMFVKLEETGTWMVVYHRDTKVMYTVSAGAYNCGTFTLLVDRDGKPLLYKN